MTTHQPGSMSTGQGSVVAANPFAAPTAFAGPGQSASPARVDPELCRVSVLSGRTQVDVALPADVPVASLIPELAGLLLRNQFGEPERVPDDLSLHWTLGKVGQKVINETHTLIEAGIVDGDLLVLRSEATTELPTVYDDVIDAVAGMPVLRPLIGTDKDEITLEAERIGTFPISIIPDEDCCTLFTPRHPVTRARIGEIETFESKLPVAEMVRAAVTGVEVEDFSWPPVAAGTTARA